MGIPGVAGAKGKKGRSAAVAEPAAVYAVADQAGRSRTPGVRMGTSKGVGRAGQPMGEKGVLRYASRQLDAFVSGVSIASPMQLLETERMGVDAAFLDDMAKRMDVSYSRLAETLGIPKATAARKLANNEKINGAAAIALARLLATASEIVQDSTAPEAQTFDTARWLGQWIERPQPALGGRKPAELLDTPTGVAMVTKLLGAIRSGAYQ